MNSYTFPGEGYIGWSENMITEISIPWDAIGSPTSVDFVIWAQWQIKEMFGHHSLHRILQVLMVLRLFLTCIVFLIGMNLLIRHLWKCCQFRSK